MDTLLVQPIDDLLPTAITVFSPDGQYPPFDVRIHLPSTWPFLGVLVLSNELTQTYRPHPLQPTVYRRPVLPHPLRDHRYLNPCPMQLPR
jgi:hypothetical protein